jgi:hypothetical protein
MKENINFELWREILHHTILSIEPQKKIFRVLILVF